MTYLIELKLKAVEPCLFPKGRERGNHFEGLDYIPGSAVRGSIANLMAMEKASDSDFSQVIGHGMVMSNFYPAGVIPVPKTIKRCKRWKKEEKGTHYVGKFTPGNDNDDKTYKCELCDSPVVSVQGYLRPDKDGFLFTNNAGTTRVITHNRIDRSSGITGKDEGSLFSVEVLEENQEFLGWCQWDDVDLRDNALEYLKKKSMLMLGKMRGRGYGHVEIISCKPINEKTAGEMYLQNIGKERFQNPLTFTLLQDGILVDKYMQSSVFPQENLDLPVGVELDDNGAWTDFHSVHGFNYKRGVISPVENALKPGSTFILRSSLDSDQVKFLESNGIGVRKCDGFGLVVCGLAELIDPEDIIWQSESVDKITESKDLEQIQTFIRANSNYFSSLPSKSQLMDVLSAFRNNTESAVQLIDNQANKGTHKNQWERKVKVDGKDKQFNKWLSDLIRERCKVQGSREALEFIEIFIHAINASRKNKVLNNLWKGGIRNGQK